MAKAFQELSKSSDRDAWLADRLTGIGASEAAAVLGVDPFQTRFGVYARKLGLVADRTPTEAMEWGLILEPIVFSEYQRRHGLPVVPAQVLVRKIDAEPVLCTADAIIGGEIADGEVVPLSKGRSVDYLEVEPLETCEDCARLYDELGPGVLEAKTTNVFQAKEWHGGPPDDRAAQVCQQLTALGLKWGVLAVIIGGQQWGHHHLELDADFGGGQGLVDRVGRFWRDHVEAGVPPELTGDELSVRLMGDLFPEELANRRTALPDEGVGWHLQLRQAQEDMADAKRRRDRAKAHLQGLIGAAEFGDLPDGLGCYRWATQTRAAHFIPESSYRALTFHKPRVQARRKARPTTRRRRRR